MAFSSVCITVPVHTEKGWSRPSGVHTVPERLSRSPTGKSPEALARAEGRAAALRLAIIEARASKARREIERAAMKKRALLHLAERQRATLRSVYETKHQEAASRRCAHIDAKKACAASLGVKHRWPSRRLAPASPTSCTAVIVVEIQRGRGSPPADLIARLSQPRASASPTSLEARVSRAKDSAFLVRSKRAATAAYFGSFLVARARETRHSLENSRRDKAAHKATRCSVVTRFHNEAERKEATLLARLVAEGKLLTEAERQRLIDLSLCLDVHSISARLASYHKRAAANRAAAKHALAIRGEDYELARNLADARRKEGLQRRVSRARSSQTPRAPSAPHNSRLALSELQASGRDRTPLGLISSNTAPTVSSAAARRITAVAWGEGVAPLATVHAEVPASSAPAQLWARNLRRL